MILRNPSLLALLAAELVSRVGSQMTFLVLVASFGCFNAP